MVAFLALVALVATVSTAAQDQLVQKVLREFRIARAPADELTAKVLAHHHATIATLDKHKQRIHQVSHAHPFVVQLDPQRCASSAASCHKQLQNHPLVGVGRYDILSEDLAVATLLLSALQELSYSPSASSSASSPPLVRDFLALSPELKMSPEVSEMRGASSDACLSTRKPSFSGKLLQGDPIAHKSKTKAVNESTSRHPFQLQFVMHAPSSQTLWESFVSFLSALEEEFNTGEDSAQAVVREIFLDVDERNGYHGERRAKALAHGSTVSAWRTNPHRPTAATRAQSLSWKNDQLEIAQPGLVTGKISGVVRITDCTAVHAIAERLAARPEVAFLSRRMPTFTMNKYAQYTCDTGEFNVSSLIRTMQQATGESPAEVIGVADTGIDVFNCFFYDPNISVSYQTNLYETVLNPLHRKIEQYVSFKDSGDSNGGHGTHVAGSLAGDAPSSSGLEDYDMNPNVKLAFFDIGYSDDTSGSVDTPLNIAQDMFEVLYSSGAKIFSNSWGSLDKVYDWRSFNVDAFMWEHPDALVLFAAGNEGEYGQFTVASPATAKNSLTVGASVSDATSWSDLYGYSIGTFYDKDSVAYFSSQGPTVDGRLKPEVLAPGYFVISAMGKNSSTEPFCGLHYLSGTSMATPVAASFAATVRRYFVDGFYPTGQSLAKDGFTPSGALVKAMMVHSAQLMKYAMGENSAWISLTEYPSVLEGYGRINLNNTLNFKGMPLSTGEKPPLFDLFVVGAATAASNKHYFAFSEANVRHTFYVRTKQGDADKLRVTLSYTDYPGWITVWRVMMNQLTLTVKEVGTSYSFTPYQASPVIDNTQVIHIPGATPDTVYAISVTADRVISSDQPYALVVTGSFSVLNDGIPEITAVDAPIIVESDSSSWTKNGTIIIVVVVVVGGVVLIGMLTHCLCMYSCKKSSKSSNHHSHHHHQGARADSIAAVMLADDAQHASVPNKKAEIELSGAEISLDSA